jgi:hypothetical protein
MIYYVDPTIYARVKKLSDESKIDEEYGKYQSLLIELKLQLIGAFLQEKGSTKQQAQEFVTQLQKSMTADAEAAAEIAESVAKLYPDEYSKLQDPELITKLGKVEEAYHKDFYETANKNLSAEDKQWLNTYLDGIDTDRKNLQEDLIALEVENVIDGGKPSPELLAALEKLPEDALGEAQTGATTTSTQSESVPQAEVVPAPEPTQPQPNPVPVPDPDPAPAPTPIPTPAPDPIPTAAEAPAAVTAKGLTPTSETVPADAATPAAPVAMYPEN